jgi:tRNA G18 (ribose-2'-O)-methylase SpoU
MLCGEVPDETPLTKLGSGIVMLEGITSSENVGAIARSAAGLGVGSLLLPARSPHPFGRRALRVSMGYAARLKFHRYDDPVATIRYLRQAGYAVVAAEITPESLPLSRITVPPKWVLVLGHEGHGLAPELLAECNAVAHIEMDTKVKSLNIAAAAAIMLYRFQTG